MKEIGGQVSSDSLGVWVQEQIWGWEVWVLCPDLRFWGVSLVRPGRPILTSESGSRLVPTNIREEPSPVSLCLGQSAFTVTQFESTNLNKVREQMLF